MSRLPGMELIPQSEAYAENIGGRAAAVLSLRAPRTLKTFGNDVMARHASTDGEMTAMTA